jgi:hypothetical protein
VCGNFSQGAGTSGTGSDIAFSQLAVKGLIVGTGEAQVKNKTRLNKLATLELAHKENDDCIFSI